MGQSETSLPAVTMDIDCRVTVYLSDDAIVMDEHKLSQALEDALLEMDIVSSPAAWAVVKHAQVLHAYDRRLNRAENGLSDDDELRLDGRGVEERRSLDV